MTSKPLASLSLDLDNQWSYMKTHGDRGWETFPSYLDVVVPRVLDFFAARKQRITFFVVGQDAAMERNHEALGELARAGHEIGNHSFHHEPWLHLYSEDEVEAEIARAEEEIERATGRRTEGFRGPGYSISKTTLRVLQRRGYRYDASTLPTFIGPVARAYYFMTAKLDEADKARRKELFGSIRDGLRPVRPYRWSLEPGSLLEIPVTTFPLLKVPFHLSYVLYLSTFSPWLARTYFTAALRSAHAIGLEPSLLLHPLDFLGADEVSALEFFPGMKLPVEVKLERVAQYLDELFALFDVRPLGEHARAIDRRADLRLEQPVFST